MKFLLTPAATRDLDQIWDYIADDNVEAADRVLSALEKAMQRLVRRPGIGHLRESLADRSYRFFLVYSYLIVYRPETRHSKSFACCTHPVISRFFSDSRKVRKLK